MSTTKLLAIALPFLLLVGCACPLTKTEPAPASAPAPVADDRQERIEKAYGNGVSK